MFWFGETETLKKGVGSFIIFDKFINYIRVPINRYIEKKNLHESFPSKMSNQDSNLSSLLSPARSGTLFAPFRSRSANPDGFDSKMRLWINSIEEWAILNKKLIFCLEDIHQTFISDNGIRPDKECIRLVLSEMKRESRLVPLNSLRTSNIWATSTTRSLMLDSLIDPKTWLGWGVKKLVFDPATWAVSTLTNGNDPTYSDLTDLSINDKMKFVSSRSLGELSQRLQSELIRIGKAEKQFCFEWQHLLELISPIMNTIIDVTDGKELLKMLDILIEYLAVKRHIAIQMDDDSKLIKIANPEDSNDEVKISRKDIAMARLLRAKELLTADADKYHSQAQRARHDAVASFKKREVAKAKSLLRSHKRFSALAEQKESQLTNVEIMSEQLANTDSNMMILKAYKDGADALRIANTNLDNNTSIFDDVYDATAEASYLNTEMSQMINDLSHATQPINDTLNADLEAELERYASISDKDPEGNKILATGPNSSLIQNQSVVDDKFVDELEQRLNSLVVCQDDPNDRSVRESSPKREVPVLSKDT